MSAFRRILTHKGFSTLPMVIETPKDGDDEFEMDLRNLATLRKIAATGGPPLTIGIIGFLLDRVMFALQTAFNPFEPGSGFELCARHLHGSIVHRVMIAFGAPLHCVRCRAGESPAIPEGR